MTTTERQLILQVLKNTYNETTDGPHDAAILKAITWAETCDDRSSSFFSAIIDLSECWEYWGDSCGEVAAYEIRECEECVADYVGIYGL